MTDLTMKNGSTITLVEGSGEKVTGYAQKYLDKELVNPIPEVLPPDYDELLDTQAPTMPELEAMAKAMTAFDEAMSKVFGKPF